jgi:hypothetical protein
MNFADDSTVIGLITNDNESAYREEVSELALWCHDNNHSLKVSKTKELIVKFRKQRWEHALIHINRTAVVKVTSFKFFSVHITEDMSWTNTTTTLVKTPQDHDAPAPSRMSGQVASRPGMGIAASTTTRPSSGW